MTFKIRQKDSVAYFDAQAGYGLVDMSLQAGAALPHGCGHGQCGNCTVQVVSGDYQYLHGYRPDALLTPQQQAQGWVISCMI
jgi:ferredoxin